MVRDDPETGEKSPVARKLFGVLRYRKDNKEIQKTNMVD